MAVIKTKYQLRLNLEREMGVAVSQIRPRFDEVCKNKQTVNDAHFFVVSSINKTSINTKLSIKFLLLVRRKSSKLFQRRRNEESLRVSCPG